MEIFKVFIDWFLMLANFSIYAATPIIILMAITVFITGDKSYFKKKFDRIGRD